MKTLLTICAMVLLAVVPVSAETCTEYALDLTTGLPWPAEVPWIEGTVLWRGATFVRPSEQGEGVEYLAVLQLKVASTEDDRLWLHLKDLACGVTTLDPPAEPAPATDAGPVIEEIPAKYGYTWRVKHRGEWWYGR